MIAEAIQGHFLLGHHFDGALVHLGVVDADAAEDGEGLKQSDVRLIESGTSVL